MTSETVDHNALTKSPNLPSEAASSVDDLVNTTLPVVGLQNLSCENKVGDSNVIGRVDREPKYRILKGYEHQLDGNNHELVLGKGSFGEVFLATELELNRPVAIKTLQRKHLTNQSLVDHFFLEGKLTSRLQHPGIPPVHAIGFWNDCPAIVMKAVVGKTLKDYLRETRLHTSSNRTKGIDYFLQVCRAVAYAHANETWHLDLKSKNIMIGAQDEIQVLDWGLAREVDNADPENIGGTPEYMPPEQANASLKEIGPHSDVFSLGALLTEILTGKPPYVVSEIHKSIRMMARTAELSDCFHRLNNLENEDPALAPLTGLARWCLSKPPAMRPKDASIVVEALTSYQEGLRLQVQQDIADRARREQQAIVDRARFRARATMLGTVAVLSLIAIGSAIWSVATVNARNAGYRADLAKIDQLIRSDSDGSIDEARRYFANVVSRATNGKISQADLRNIHQGKSGLGFAKVVARASDGTISQEVLHEINEGKADLDFIVRRNEVRQSLAEFTNGLELNSGTALQYGSLFQEYGISVKNTKEAAELIHKSRIQPELLAGLDHWSLVSDDIQKLLLWQLAMEASNDGWCRKFRSPQNRANPEALKSLLTEIPWDGLTATELESTARELDQRRLYKESLEVLRKAVLRFPKDFWLNLLLGQKIAAAELEGDAASRQKNALEAISYLRAALAINENAHVYSEISRVSLAGDDLEAAEMAAHQALKLDNNTISSRYYLAQIRLRQNNPREAVSIATQALELVKSQSPLQPSPWLKRLNELIESVRK